ncbi:MAG: hypothetical protein Q7I92_14795, partial [Humidesulfovibrio sp.]|nr:hypothetical protein [Humidesulfovibrio sp.]
TAHYGKISRLETYDRCHHRHFTQQSEYTFCVFRDNNTWKYLPHDEVWDKPSMKKIDCIKYTIPTTEKKKVLKILDRHNINEHTLFHTEESLIKAVANREMLFPFMERI